MSAMAPRVISLRCGIWSLSGHSDTISDTTWGFGDLAPFGRLQIKATPSPSFYSGTNTQTAEAYRKTLVKQ